MKKIALLATGGTIASNETSEGRLRAGERSGEELVDMCDIPFDLDLQVTSLFNKPSLHLDYEDLWTLRANIVRSLREKTIDGVLVTSGTDTLEEVAYFLDLTIEHDKPIVVTGSQRGPSQVGSDAFVNLRNAMIAAADEQVAQLGPVVIFNECILSAKYVRKAHASNVQGFDALGYGYFGIVDNDRVNLYQRPIRRDVYVPRTDITHPRVRVEIVSVHFGMSPVVLQYLLQSAAVDAIVLEGLGRGQVPPAFMPLIADAHIPIVITTSAAEGDVHPTYDYEGSTYDLMNHGVILGKDYSSRKAKMKLYVLLETGVDELSEAFQR